LGVEVAFVTVDVIQGRAVVVAVKVVTVPVPPPPPPPEKVQSVEVFPALSMQLTPAPRKRSSGRWVRLDPALIVWLKTAVGSREIELDPEVDVTTMPAPPVICGPWERNALESVPPRAAHSPETALHVPTGIDPTGNPVIPVCTVHPVEQVRVRPLLPAFSTPSLVK
jgi:hypothetical protein